MKNRVKSIVVTFIMIFSTMIYFPPNVIAEVNNLNQSNVEVTTNVISSDELEITMRSYLTHDNDSIMNIQASDIILLFDQSEASAENKKTILDGVYSLLDGLPSPTDTSTQHRVAIAGFGRINNYGEFDIAEKKYNTLYDNFCYNTGYYTMTNGIINFNSWGENFWIEAVPPTFNGNLNYDDCFMSLDNAKQIISYDNNNMVSWNAKASRTDVGIVLANELANIHDKNRPLMIVLISSGVPIQNIGTDYYTRSDALIQASNNLKNQYPDATIYGLGDYHKLNDDAVSYGVDTPEKFDELMSIVPTDNKYYSTNNYESLENSINSLLKTVNQDISTDVSKQSITLDTSNSNIDDILNDYTIDTNNVTVNYYQIVGYDVEGNPNFDETPYIHTENNTISFSNNILTYTDNILPTLSYSSYINADKNIMYGEEIEVIIRCKLNKNTISISKNLENTFDSNNYNFWFYIVGYDLIDNDKKIYETWLEVTSNGDGVLLNDIPNGSYTIKELDTSGFEFLSYTLDNQTFYNDTVELSLKGNKDVNIIYNNKKISEDIPKTVRFDNTITFNS